MLIRFRCRGGRLHLSRTFTDLDAGKSIAAGMYDKDVDVILAAAGVVGVGAINEAKTRAESGEDVYVIGVDVDQMTRD